jgi:hypothetical protein
VRSERWLFSQRLATVDDGPHHALRTGSLQGLNLQRSPLSHPSLQSKADGDEVGAEGAIRGTLPTAYWSLRNGLLERIRQKAASWSAAAPLLW